MAQAKELWSSLLFSYCSIPPAPTDPHSLQACHQCDLINVAPILHSILFRLFDVFLYSISFIIPPATGVVLNWQHHPEEGPLVGFELV